MTLYRTRWYINKALIYLWSFLSAAGVVVLAIDLRKKDASKTAVLAALALTLGSVAYALVNDAQQNELVGYLEGKFPDYHAYGKVKSLGKAVLTVVDSERILN